MPLQMHLDTRHPEPERALEEFTIDRPGTIIAIGHHLSTNMQIRCLIRVISLSGVVLEVNKGVDIPNHFFLEILGIHDEIGCTLIKREGETATIGFNMLINPEFLHHVIRLNFETSH
jgi:hypothetical protein